MELKNNRRENNQQLEMIYRKKQNKLIAKQSARLGIINVNDDKLKQFKLFKKVNLS